MTKVRANYVCENANYAYALALKLPQYILVGHGEVKYGKTIVADIFEALMGAIYIDLGYATVRNVVLNIIVPYLENPKISFFSDYKSSLQEYVQTEQKSLEYVLTNEEGPAHMKTFTMNVVIDGIVYGSGVGRTKKDAEQEAAKEALEKLAIKK
jgi:ribonuclease-3